MSMTRLSIKAKITIWVSLLVFVIAVFSAFTVIFFSNSVIQSTMKRNLITAVEGNIGEIRIYSDKKDLKLDDEYDVSIEFKGSFIEIDDDFVREVDGVITCLYDNDSVLYGDSVIDTDEFALQEKGIRTINADGKRYFVYDKHITDSDADSLWIRGIISADLILSQTFSIAKESFILIPILALIAVLGAFLLAKKALAPIDEISSAAGKIRRGKDLTKRIAIKSSEKEVSRLVNSFNEMLERLESAFNKEQQFTSDVSHELRTPLSVILSECELMLESASDEEEYKFALSTIQKQSKKMNSMINSLLEYSRLEAGSEKANFEVINLSDITESICEEMKGIRNNGIKLDYDIDEDIFVKGNRELLSRLITNLISNAYKYGRENGNIFVSLKANDSLANLKVRDNGIGISEKDINNIFNTFYRADSSRSKKGFGLGLSFVKKIAQLHGGDIRVNSVEGSGSEFIFSIKKFEKS